MVTVAAVMTSYNRREHTLACLRSLKAQSHRGLTAFVVDDASTDGTADAIAAEFPEVEVIRGTGDLFWNGGMGVGMGRAAREDFDFYWWINDDVILEPDALRRLLSAADRLGRPGILVGSMRDIDDGSLTYGGVTLGTRVRPLRTTLVVPTDTLTPAATMNGNCVLIPREVWRGVGNLDPGFRQQMGDLDYGLRATALGYKVWVAPGFYGTCSRNPEPPAVPLRKEIGRIWSAKELPPRAWFRFTRRWAGPVWPIQFVSPYLRRASQAVVRRIRNAGSRKRA